MSYTNKNTKSNPIKQTAMSSDNTTTPTDNTKIVKYNYKCRAEFWSDWGEFASKLGLADEDIEIDNTLIDELKMLCKQLGCENVDNDENISRFVNNNIEQLHQKNLKRLT